MKIGYARVSTEEQNLELQRQALKTAGCEIIYEDKGISGASTERNGLSEALERIGKDDILRWGFTEEQDFETLLLEFNFLMFQNYY